MGSKIVRGWEILILKRDTDNCLEESSEIFRLYQSLLEIPREWTDKGDPNPYQFITDHPPVLSIFCLQKLVCLIDALSRKITSK
jgi:hypothetical protein